MLFAPGEAGIRRATVSIASNDPNETPYTFTLTGTGLVPRHILTIETTGD
jgi:hypothetical protein